MLTSRQLRNRISRTYIIALGVIALLLTVFFFYPKYTFTEKSILPRIINIAGKQRMLSQRIALIEHALVADTSFNNTLTLQEQLREAAEEFQLNHEVLVGRRKIDGQYLPLTEALNEHYNNGLLSLDERATLFANSAMMLAKASPQNLKRMQPVTLQSASELLEYLDRAVHLFEESLNKQLVLERNIASVAWIVTLLTMLSCVFLLFRPLEKMVLEQFKEANAARENVQLQKFNADRADQVRSEFLARMSHEFRTPISSIIGALELIPNMRSKQSQLIQQAEKSCYRLLTLTNNLLDIIGVSTASTPTDKEQFDLIKLLDECIAPLSSLCRDKKLDFTMHCESALPQYVKGSPVNLAKALKNLIDNAVKFTDRGLVSVNVDIKVVDQQFMLYVRIVDTGIGIAAEEQERIFERFYQVPNKDKRHNGAGIGLTVARQHMRNMGGDITVLSQEGVGSEFTLKAPLQSTSIKPRVVKGNTQARFAIVDDLEISRLHLANLIQNEGFDVDCFKSGTELLGQHEDILRYNGIIADFFMPGISGIELATTLSAIYGDKLPPLIMVSATPDIANIVASSRLSVWQVFVKPIDRNRFIDAIHQLVRPTSMVVKQKAARVLIVEDEPINAEIIDNMVRNMGYTPVIARDGESALTTAQTQDFDVILMDINLPDISGLEVANIIREGGSSTPIVAVTANAYDSDREDSLQAGIRYHLVKPVTYQELKNTLKLTLTLPH